MPKTPGKPPFSIVSGETTVVLPPRKLGTYGTALWDRVQREYAITDCGGTELLCLAAQELDRAESLAEAIARDGAVIYSRAGAPRAHPAVRDELQARAFVVKTIEKLGINFEAVKPHGGQPRAIGWTGGR